jgi:glycosyltransferase involved in cell wall biosynthesis
MLGHPFTAFLQRLKRRIHKNSHIAVIAPSEWIRQLADKSGVFPQRPQLIPYGVDVESFQPVDKRTLRSQLGLPVDKHIIVYVANHLDDPRKGFGFAIEAVHKLNMSRKETVLLAIGHPPRPNSDLRTPHIDCLMYEFVQDKSLLMKLFASADVFLFPTVQDNLPFVVLENMAVGTPAVAFKTGGIPEMVVHNKTGFLVEQGDAEGLVEGLKEGLYRGKAREWGAASRTRAEYLYSLETYARAHISLYDSIL